MLVAARSPLYPSLSFGRTMASESSAAASNGVHDPTLSEPASPRTPNGGAVSKSAAGHSRAQEKFEVKAVSVPYGREREGVVYYIVNVEDTNSKKWSIEKRYSAFERLHSVLTELFAHRGFPPGADLPPKKVSACS
jgi:hypothetical protein